jgi:hypothetical protein
MAETIKSALFVDYDSFHRGEQDETGNTAERLAQTSAAWVAALEAGRLVTPPPDNGARRRVLIRRCYADPQLLGLNRSALIAAGFEVIDCPHQAGRKHNPADIHMVIDTIDALEHPAGYEEFILLSADADLTPVLLRLRAHNRTSVIYADEATAAGYKAIADGMIDAARFRAVLDGKDVEEKVEAVTPLAEEVAAPAATAAAADAAPADRADIEALARKVHAATNVPMFSPKTFADLFRLLAQEIGERGYHFQNTAENVTEKLAAAGRNVNRRQVLFVVRGLALKGHVFSTTDTPERLAEVFREQVLYLIGNSELQLSEREKALLPAWIVGRAAQAKPVPAASPPTAPQRPQATRPAATPPIRPGPDDSARKSSPIRRRVTRPATAAEEEPIPAAKPAPAPPSPLTEKRTPTAPAAKAAAPVGSPTPAAKPDLRSTVASRFAAITKGSFASRSAGETRPKSTLRPAAGETAARPLRPAAANGLPGARPGGAKPAKPADEPPKDELESSILAAIAQAVDVLVEDGGGDKSGNRDPAAAAPPEPAAPAAGPAPPPDPEPSPGGDSEDIGDEIQRIIASYSRARQQGD